jgi:hypothetical protein
MNVAVIGWGSLIWDPRELAKRSRWHRSGPRLPIEFARVSKDRRLTLVLHAPSKPQQAYWACSTLASVQATRSNLAAREKAPIEWIHTATRGEPSDPASSVEVAVCAWLRAQPDLDAAVWTGLPATLDGPDLVAQSVAHVASLRAVPNVYARAREYVVRAPGQIQTVVRSALRAQGWLDEELAADLFEP